MLSNLPGVKARDFIRKPKRTSFWIFNINVDVNSAFIYVDIVEAGTRGVKGSQFKITCKTHEPSERRDGKLNKMLIYVGLNFCTHGWKLLHL